MKISQAIKYLQKVKKDEGDLEIVCMTEVDGAFCIEHGRVFDVIQLPGEDDELEGPIVAFMEPVEENDGHYKEMKPKLKRIK
jgi:hypothetical protein